ncbi:MAG: glutathione S-transferase family protein [Candidatus Binataceae bacterium]
MDLYHNNMSVCSQKVRLVIYEKRITPVEHHLDLRAGESHTADYLRLNPKGVVPTIVENGEPITESTVICEYLDDAYPYRSVRPLDARKRARMRQWVRLPDVGLHEACATLSVAIAFRRQILKNGGKQFENRPNREETDYLRRLVAEGLDAPGVAHAIKFYDNTLSEMSAHLDMSPWLAGDEYSLADIALVPYVIRLDHLRLSWLWEGERASIAGWIERNKARPNFNAIANYLEPDYLTLMDRTGREATPKIRQILAAHFRQARGDSVSSYNAIL